MKLTDETIPIRASPDNVQVISGGITDFRTTHWSVVLCAGHESSPESALALETLCHVYWYPLYVYVRR